MGHSFAGFAVDKRLVVADSDTLAGRVGEGAVEHREELALVGLAVAAAVVEVQALMVAAAAVVQLRSCCCC